MIRIGLPLICLLALPIVVTAEEEAKHTTDAIETVKQNLGEKKALLLDVREEKEWKRGHLEIARLVPLSKLLDVTDEKSIDGVAKDKIVYLHCASGGRVLSACKVLKEMGYDVRPLKWGYSNLLEEGFEKAK